MRSVLLISTLLCALPALGNGFAGVLELRVSSGGGVSGTVKMTVGDAGSVTEMNMGTPAGPMKMKALMRKARPDVIWLIDDARRTVSELPSGAAAQAMSYAGGGAEESWTVKRLGTETVAGFATVHVKAISGRTGTETELWTTRQIMSGDQYVAALGKEARMTSTLLAALKKEDADGFPVKLVTTSRDGGRVTFELVKVTPGQPAPATFEVPAGYTPSALPALPGVPPDAAKMLEEQMKQMTPEQQEMMRKMMQGR